MAEELQVDETRIFDVPVRRLLLDANNPRFGSLSPDAGQRSVLDHIVENFGVDDVLSSIAVNGFFSAEPIVCRRIEASDDLLVQEGNRRLAACLILLGDDRARNHASKTATYQKIWKEHGAKKIDPLPAMVFGVHEKEEALISYLGVRHIASARTWDSYAKAAWVAKAHEQAGLSVDDISNMIGDTHRTVARLLEGYYFVNQLIEAGIFTPSDSVRKGRGSVTDYPFSWVYTILGYKAVRDYLSLPDTPQKYPLSKSKLERGDLVLATMFGDRSTGQNGAIRDSRQISDLSKAFADPEQIAMLEAGKTIEEIQLATLAIEERLSKGLIQVRDILGGLYQAVAAEGLESDTALKYLKLANGNQRLASQLHNELKRAVAGDDELD